MLPFLNVCLGKPVTTKQIIYTAPASSCCYTFNATQLEPWWWWSAYWTSTPIDPTSNPT